MVRAMRARAFRRALSTTRAFDPLVFVDDKKSLHGRMVNGIKVYPPEQLPALIKDRNIDRILLALPSLTRRRRREILSSLEPLGRARANSAGIRAAGDRHRDGGRHSRGRRLRSSGTRFGAAEARSIRRLHSRSGRHGNRGRRLDWLRAL